MPRGGKRAGAGRKFKWKHGTTVAIRVPEVLSEKILQFAQALDRQEIKWDPEGEFKVAHKNARELHLDQMLKVYQLRGKDVIQLSDFIKILEQLVE